MTVAIFYVDDADISGWWMCTIVGKISFNNAYDDKYINKSQQWKSVEIAVDNANIYAISTEAVLDLSVEMTSPTP